MRAKLFQRLMILAIIVLSFLLFSTSVSAASLKGKSVLIDGDSLARGSHATVNNGRYSYGDYLASLGADVTNVAVSGARFYYPGGGDLEIINHLSDYAKSKSFDYIVLQGGDNDVDHYNELDNTYNSIETYFQTVKGVPAWQNSKFFFIITPHMDRSSGVLSKANDLWGKVKRLCTKYQIKCINFFKTSENDGNSVPSGFNYNLMSNRISYDQNASVEGSVDGSHPSQKAHNTMGQIIAKKFKTATSDPSDPSNQKTAGNEVETYTPSVSTYDGTVETSLFGNMQDDGEGCGVYTVLSTVIDALSIGVGILAAIGIAFMGAKYIASKGDIEQTKKAKRRLYEIIIGLLAYVLLYAGVQWLLPGGHFNANQSCKTLTAEEISARDAKIAAARAENQAKQETAKKQTTQKHSTKTTKNTDQNGTTAKGKKILEYATKVAKKINDYSYSYSGANFSNKNLVYKTHTVNCASYASLVMAEAGLLAMGTGRVASDNYGEFTILKLGDYKKYWQFINNPYGSKAKTVAYLVKNGKLAPGDICGSASYVAHTFIYAGKKGQKYQFYEVSSTGTQTYSNIINNYHDGNYKIGQCLHAK